MKLAPMISTLAILAVTATPTFALTADEVWAKYEILMRVQADKPVSIESTSRDGNVLTISGIKVETSQPDLSTSVSIDAIRLIENADGSVNVETSEVVPIVIESSSDETRVELELRQSGAKNLVTGTSDAMTVETSVDALSVTMTELQNDDVTEDERFSLSFISFQSSGVLSESAKQDATFSAASMDFEFGLKDVQENEAFDFSGSAKDLKGNFAGDLTQLSELGNGGGMPKDLAADLGLSFASAETNFEVISESDPIKGKTATGAYDIRYSIADNALVIEGGAKDVAFNFEAQQLPPGIAFEMADMSVAFGMPLAVNEVGPYKYNILMDGLKLSDTIWNLADPGQQFPRDPMSIEVALSGQAKWTVDIFSGDPEELASDEIPMEFENVSIDKVMLSAVGASISGQGGFTFDNTDLKTIPDFPRPEGAFNLTILGANALLDTVAAAGLVGAEELMGVRMGMGMFTQPGDGEDELKSELIVNPEGHVIVNGVRMQ